MRTRLLPIGFASLLLCGCRGEAKPPPKVDAASHKAPNADASMTAEDWLNRGNELRQSDKEGSVNAYTMALELDPSLDEAVFNRACAHSELGQDRQAVADLKLLVDRESDLAEELKQLFATIPLAYVSIGTDALQSGDYDLAMEKYSAAVVYDPQNADGHVGCGLVHKKLGRIDDAFTCYSKAIEVDPNCAIAFHNRGELFLARKEFQKAVSDFTRAIEIDPDASSYDSRALAFEGAGETAKADDDRRTAAGLKAKSAN